jgi:hypothetical protein
MADVLPFQPRRPGDSDGYDGLRCPDCGCAWFHVGGFTDDDCWIAGDLCFNAEGSVTGYSGTPHCVDCGREVLP